MSPAGWAFLPPLQRQLSDAPPVVLRPAFVATLPTRTVPASLGTMGHLVDAAAPSGTVAADDAALGAPVQRAVAAELTLRPQRGAARSVAVQRQAVTDAAEPTSHESPVSSAAPDEPVDVLEGSDPVTEDTDDGVLEQASASSVEAGRDGTSVARLVDASLSVLPVVSDPTDARRPAITHASVEAPASAALTLPDRHDASPSAAEPPAPSADQASPSSQDSPPPASVVRLTLQRMESVETEAGTGAGVEAGARMPPSTEALTKRVGLGAPLPSRPVQRARSDDAPGHARREDARPGIGPLPATPTHVDGLPSSHNPVLQRDVDAGEAPLLADLPIPSVVAPADSTAASTPRPTPPPQGDAAPGATSASRPLASAVPAQNRPLAAVQRRAETVAGRIPTPRSLIADPSPVGPVPHAPELADGLPAAATSTEAALVATTPAEAVSTDGGSVVDVPSGRAETEFSEGPALPVQRTVPLVAARRIVPVLDRQTLALPAATRSSQVVVARVVAPSPTASEGGSAAPVSTSGTRSRASASAAAIGVTATGSRSTSRESAGSAAAEPWTSGPDGAASVSRLLDPPHTDAIEGWTDARAPAPAWVVAPATPRTSTGPRFDSNPPVVQRLPGFPSLPKLPSAPPSGLPSPGQLPSGLPSMPQLPTDVPSLGQLPGDLPSREQLESRATDLASEARDSARSAAETLTAPAAAAASGIAAAAGGGTENVEQLVRKLYGPLVRRIKAELLLDRERRGIRIDGI